MVYRASTRNKIEIRYISHERRVNVSEIQPARIRTTIVQVKAKQFSAGSQTGTKPPTVIFTPPDLLSYCSPDDSGIFISTLFGFMNATFGMPRTSSPIAVREKLFCRSNIFRPRIRYGAQGNGGDSRSSVHVWHLLSIVQTTLVRSPCVDRF